MGPEFPIPALAVLGEEKARGEIAEHLAWHLQESLFLARGRLCPEGILWRLSDEVPSWGQALSPLLWADALILEGAHPRLPSVWVVRRGENTIPPEKLLAVVCEDGLPPSGFFAVPAFSPFDLEPLARLWLKVLDKTSKRPLLGLILTGGESRRMGRDKAALEIDGKTQIHRLLEMLSGFCDEVFISCRSEQKDDSLRRLGPQIHDLFSAGPLGGMLSAMRAHPQAAWLVLAVDLLRLQESTLAFLVDHRNPLRFATAFSGEKGLEPLCAIWEPKAREALAHFWAGGISCPKKVLDKLAIKTLLPPYPHHLDNFNTSFEWDLLVKA